MNQWAARFSMMAAAFALVFSVRGFAQEKPERPEKNEPLGQQQPAIKIATTLITVPVIVTDRYGRFISGLTRNDFSVSEDGAAQKLEEFSSTEAPFNVALLIDTSRSTQNKLSAIRKAAEAFIKQLQPNDRVMIVTFDEKVRFVSDFTNDPVQLQRAVKSLKSSYLTSLYDAIYLTVTEKMNAIKGRKALVVLTDGVDTASKQATFESTLNLVASMGIVAYTIQYETRNDGGPVMKPIFLPNGHGSSFVSHFSGGSSGWRQQEQTQSPARPESETKPTRPGIINIPRPTTSIMNPGSSSTQAQPQGDPGSKPATSVNSFGAQPLRDRYLIAADFLRTLASLSGAQYIRAENIENTSYAFRLIGIELRNQYTLTYISNNEQRDGGYRAIAVNVRGNDLRVRSRLGYRAAKSDPAETPADKKP